MAKDKTAPTLEKALADVEPIKMPSYLGEIIAKVSMKGQESPRAFIMIVAAYADDLLTKLLQRSMVVSNGDEDDLFDANAALYHMGPKVTLAYRMGLISAELRWLLNMIRRLRDECAHSHDTRTFAEARVKDRISEMHSKLDLSEIEIQKADTTEKKFADVCKIVFLLLWLKLENAKPIRQRTAEDFLR